MKKKKIFLAGIFALLVFIFGCFFYVNISCFKNMSYDKNTQQGMEEVNNTDLPEADKKYAPNAVEANKEMISKKEAGENLNEETDIAEGLEINITDITEKKDIAKENIQPDVKAETVDEDKKILDTNNEAKLGSNAGQGEIPADIILEQDSLKESTKEIEIVTAGQEEQTVIIQEPTKDLEEIKAQINEKDREEGEKIASKVDLSLINEYLEDGITQEEKGKIDAYLRECLTPSEYERARELLNKYIHLLEE